MKTHAIDFLIWAKENCHFPFSDVIEYDDREYNIYNDNDMSDLYEEFIERKKQDNEDNHI